MKIIRALWGNQDRILNEIPSSPIFDDEVVYVWGTENQKYLLEKGYQTILVNPGFVNPDYSTIYDHFAHKLEAFMRAENDFGEFLFLDWDVKIIKEIDSHFWNLVRVKKLQCPLYGYPNDYERKINDYVEKNPQVDWAKNFDNNIKLWLAVQSSQFKRYSWKYENFLIVPNLCFFYSNNSGAPTKLMSIYDTGEIKTCIEEFAMFVYANCTPEEFIQKYEPFVIRGRESDHHHFDIEYDDSSKQINKFIESKILKDIYLQHI